VEFVTYTQNLILPTSAIDAYECFIDERKLYSFTASPAHIQAVEQTSFTCFDGEVHGINIVLEHGYKILQTWEMNHPKWPISHSSEVCLIFNQDKVHAQQCEVQLIHSYLPEALINDIADWWNTQVWEALRFYLER
jgi:activator of HSP90 ATPase